MITITKRQKKIFILVGIVVLTFFIFIYFIFIPMSRRLAKIKKEYDDAQANIVNLKRAIGADKPLGEAILYLNKKLKAYDLKFPEKEEVVLLELSAQAEKSGITILSMKPDRKQIVKDINGVSMNVKDRSVVEMPIALSMKAPYKKLGGFLKILKEDFPFFVSINDISMSGSGEGQSQTLTIGLNLTVYMLASSA